MPATSFTGPAGSVSRRPGVRGRIDASALNRAPAGPRRVALIGEAEGGVPITVVESGAPAVRLASSPGGVRALFRAGALRVAGTLAFRASRDPLVPNAPAEVLFCKVNPGTRGVATLQGPGGDALVVRSRDYAEFANRMSIDLDPGSITGFKAIIRLEDTVETLDDIGGEPVLTLRYPTSGDASTMTLTKNSTGVSATFTFARTIGSVDIIEDAHVAGQVARAKSNNAYDTHQTVTVYGVSSLDVPVLDRIRLNGTTVVSGTVAFKAITGVRVDGATRGEVAVDEPSLTNVAFAITATLTASHTAGNAVRVLSSSAADLGQRITIYGVDAAGQRISEAMTLAGDANVDGAKSFQKITAARLDAACAGNVTVKSVSGDVAFIIAAGSLSAGTAVAGGLRFFNSMPVDGAITLVAAGAPAGAPFAVLRGLDKSGAAVAERVLITDAPATTTTLWSRLDHLEMGLIEESLALTMSGTALSAPVAKIPTVAALVSFINGKPGFIAEVVAPDPSIRLVADLDAATSLNVRSNADVALLADLKALVDTISQRSALLTAEAAGGAAGPPSHTDQAVFLAGGSEGTTRASDWQAAFDALRSYADVIIVPLTQDAAVHTQLARHLTQMESDTVGANARQGYVGLSTILDFASLKSAVRALNNRNLASVAQSPKVYDDANAAVTLGPQYLAVMAAAMQAGSGFAEPLTWKSLDVLALEQHVSWSPLENVEAALEAGLMFARWDDGRGQYQWERGITTYRDTNQVFGEVSANESANFSRNRAEAVLNAMIGRPGFRGTASSIRSLLIAELQRQVEDGVIAAFSESSVEVQNLGDGFNAQYQAAPILPVNFIGLTARMVPLAFLAAA